MYFKGINNYGETGLILDFGTVSSKTLSQEVHFIYSRLISLKLNYLNIIPSFNKIVISFSSQKERYDALKLIEKKIQNLDYKISPKNVKNWRIPICYEDDYALDRELIQKTHQLSKEEVIAKHSQNKYYTYYIGFMPGFPYLGDIDKSLITPRLPSPRIQVPARSVGIAKEHTCIYPRISPGGWNIIGQIPFDIFSLNHTRTCLILPGDNVEFISISQNEFIKIQNKKFDFDRLIKEFSN